MDIAELKRKSVSELHEMAEELNITNYSGLRKQDLIFRIEQSLLDSDTVLRGEGVLEILPEGYGFLRSQDWNYLYSHSSRSRRSTTTTPRRPNTASPLTTSSRATRIGAYGSSVRTAISP